MAAQMAGEPKPWVMRLKWVREPWIPGSMMGAGREFPRGDRSWVSRSVNSLQICLESSKEGLARRKENICWHQRTNHTRRNWICGNTAKTPDYSHLCQRSIRLEVATVATRHLLGSEEHVLAGVNLVAFHVGPAQILSDRLGGELCLADVAKVSR